MSSFADRLLWLLLLMRLPALLLPLALLALHCCSSADS